MQEKGFLEGAQALGIPADSTGVFPRGDFIPKLGYISGVNAFVFGPEQGGKGR
jgi:hypothetical protein